jgi:DNA-binding transcriptional ArsR family regulator
MLRVHFSNGDLGRVRLAAGVDPLWETVLSLMRLQTGAGALVFDGWLRDARQHAADRQVRARLHALTTIAPRQRYFPDFLTPAAAVDGFEAGVDAVLSTPRARLGAEIAKLCRYRNRRPAGWMVGLATGDRRAMSSLGGLLRWYHRTLVAPYMRGIETAVAMDRTTRASALCAGGVDGLLATFGSQASWRSEVLEMPYPTDVDIRLQGRGITFIPSYFCWGAPVTLGNGELPPVIVYPIDHPAEDWRCTAASTGLRSLLGATRAQVLDVVADGATTGEIAARLGFSPGTASHHTAVLRDAGLITTARSGRVAQHTVTPLGEALLAGRCGHPS